MHFPHATLHRPLSAEKTAGAEIGPALLALDDKLDSEF